MRESVRDAVKRLGDGWSTSKRLPPGYWLNRETARSVERPDLVDAMVMRFMLRG
jgi:hypothetical protein